MDSMDRSIKICKVTFIVATIVLFTSFILLLNDARAETEEDEALRTESIFKEIGTVLDKIDLKQETESDRTMVIINKILYGYGYNDDTSGIMVAGLKAGDIKRIFTIHVQIHETHGTYDYIYLVNWDDKDWEKFNESDEEIKRYKDAV